MPLPLRFSPDDVLSPLGDFADILSGEECVTASAITTRLHVL